MKKLQLKAVQFGATEVLTRAQLKNVLGGNGTCAVQSADGGTLHNYSAAEAQAYATEFHTHWCCDSCSSASWYCPTGEFC